MLARLLSKITRLVGLGRAPAASYPEYISDRGHGEACMAGPGVMDDALAYLFGFDADPRSVQQLVDRFLNAPARGEIEYSMIGRTVFCTFMHVAKMSSAAEVVGISEDHECGFWVPLLARPRRGLERVVFWLPYIIIDLCEGMVTGREAWGYRKVFGQVQIPSDPGTASLFEADTHLFRTFGPDSKGEVATLVRLNRTGGGGRQPEWSSLGEAAQAVKDLWSGGEAKLKVHKWEVLLDLAEHLIEHNAPIVNLKQFRDVADSTRACYQSITESTIGVKHFHGGGLLPGDWSLDLTPCASHPIAQDLGLPAKPTASFAIWSRLDLTADLGREVWKAQ